VGRKVRKLLGVVGGLGPWATMYFLQEFLSQQKAEKDQDYYPFLVDFATEVPDRTEAILSGRTAEVEQTLLASIERLKRAGCNLIAIPCNTAHWFLAGKWDTFSVKILDMVSEVISRWEKEYPGKAFTLLATLGTLRTGLYQEKVPEGLKLVTLPEDLRQAVHRIILQVKANRLGEARESFARLIPELGKLGAEGLILGCTELGLALPEVDLPVLDSVKVLAGACLRELAM